jgi:anti-sigma regulatory factor (Ser/Thr protein kinase)
MVLISIDRSSSSPRSPSYVRESWPACPEMVPAARRSITHFAAAAGASDEQLEAIRLATSEALTNVVLHAYPAFLGHVHLTVRIAGGELWVLIADNGCGVHAGPDSRRLGLGLALISQLTDGFSIVERSSGGTELRLRYLLDPDRLPAGV